MGVAASLRLRGVKLRDMASTLRIEIELGERSYPVLIGRGLIDSPLAWSGLPSAAAAVIVTNETVAPIFAARLAAALAEHYRRISIASLPDGEVHKDWRSLNLIFDHLLQGGHDRKTVLFALGGGVVGDMTGFAAACYMRGVPFVQVPTSLLAQVDSSVGGKTAINHPMGKNMIGAFYQPTRVVCDVDTLASLPARELSSGLAEVIKYGPVADSEFLAWIERHIDALRAGDADALVHAVRRSCEIKAAVVGQDEREQGLRAVLNFGHTFGHAIETGAGYGRWLHGEAVGCGILMASDLSARLGLMPVEFVERMRALLVRAGLPTVAPGLPASRYLELMRRDKKSEGGAIKFVVIEALGRAAVRDAPDDLVTRVLRSHGASG